MSSAQRVVLVTAVVMALLMLVLPPWETPGGRFLGYSAITAPPSGDDSRPEEGGWALPKPEPIGRVSIGLLTAQFAVLWIGAGSAFLLLSRRKGDAGRGDRANGTKPPTG